MSKNSDNSEGDNFGNIWITSRVRMQAHARFTAYDLLSHVVLTFYSVTLLGFSVFTDHLTRTQLGPYTSEVSIVLSLAVLCASLVIWGLKFGKTADEHRACYLELQTLYEELKSMGEAKDADPRVEKTKYLKILERFPNHTDFDYEATLHSSLWRQGKKLEDRSGPIEFGWYRATSFWFRKLMRLLLGAFILLFPMVFLGLLYAFG